MLHKPTYTLLTFYHFVDIPESELDQLIADQWQFTHDIDLKWRVYIGTEGISATVTGNAWQLRAYRMYLSSLPYFQNIEDIDEKAMNVGGHSFDKMIVRQRDEIVALGVKYDAKTIREGGKRISIAEFKDMIDGKRDDVVILDMRNDYEYALGHFKGAIPAGTVNFRDLPKTLADYRQNFGDKLIITYCTGGIRCEKATVMMREAGMKNVAQLDGGVVKYINQFNDGNWLGNLYTFDGRVSTQVGDETTHTTIGRCHFTDSPTDNCENCRYAPCNAHMIVKPNEYRKHLGFCSDICALNAIKDGRIREVKWDKEMKKTARYFERLLEREWASIQK